MNLSKNLSRKEVACKCGCGFDSMDIETVELFQALRDYMGIPIKVNSGCRCPEHNKKEGGVENSYHVKARAIDCKFSEKDLEKAWTWLNETYPDKYGFGKYKTFIHMDTGTYYPRRWDNAA